MRIAIAQINTRAGDFGAIAERMELYAQATVDQGAELLIFPMATLTGPLPVDRSQRDGHQIDLFSTLDRLAQSAACPCLVPAVMEMDGELYHDVMLLQDGEITPLRTRAYLMDEAGRTHAGQTSSEASRTQPLTTFELNGLKFGLAMTYEDLDDIEAASDELDVVVFVSDYNYALDDAASALGAALNESRLRADATAIDAWLVAAGSLGGYDLQVYTGSSCVLSPMGELVASAPAFEETLLVAEVGSSQDGHSEQTHARALEPEIYNRSLHLWEALTLALHDYVLKQGHSDVALLLDGSLSSCLLAALCSDAVGPMHVHVVEGVGLDEATSRAARAVADALRLTREPAPYDGSRTQPSAEHLADLGQLCLMDVARRYNAVPLGAQDKTYLALEVDAHAVHVAELLPFGDVYRSDLIELAHMRNTISPVIPTDAFAFFSVPAIEGLDATEPTRELRLKRVDVTLATHIEWERPLADVIARQGEPDVTQRILVRMRSCGAARLAYPVSLVVSSRAFFMIHMPLGYAWNDVVRSEEERKRGEQPMRRVRMALGRSKTAGTSAPDYSSLLEGLELELHAGNLPEGMTPDMLAGAMGELSELLQGLVQEGDQPPFFNGPFGPLTWGSPFSEN